MSFVRTIKKLIQKIFNPRASYEHLEVSLSLVKVIAHKFQKYEFTKNKKDKRTQVILLFFNRLIIDISAINQLVKTGHYGSARTLIAVTMRNLRMFASLVDADTDRINRFWDEDESTYQLDKSFKRDFGENLSKKLAQQLFGLGTFNQIELEKSLHGSGHALRKFYTDRALIDGLRTPIVRLGTFRNNQYDQMLYLLADGFVLDFLGVFFTKYKNIEYLQTEFKDYLKLAHIAKNTNESYAREESKSN